MLSLPGSKLGGQMAVYPPPPPPPSTPSPPPGQPPGALSSEVPLAPFTPTSTRTRVPARFKVRSIHRPLPPCAPPADEPPWPAASVIVAVLAPSGVETISLVPDGNVSSTFTVAAVASSASIRHPRTQPLDAAASTRIDNT